MQREAGMAAAIVELDPLPDAVGPAAEDDDLLPVGGLRLVLGIIGRIHVGGGRGEFGGTGVDALEHRTHGELVAMLAHLVFRQLDEFAEPLVREAHGLQLLQVHGIPWKPAFPDLFFRLHDLLDLAEEPRLVFARGEDLVDGGAHAEGLGNLEEAVRRGRAQCGTNGVLVVAFAGTRNLDLVEAGEAGLEAAQRLLHRFLEAAPDGHHLAHRLHGGGQVVGGAGELLEGEARDLGDHVIDGRLEGGRRCTTGDVVGELVQRVADGQLGRDLGDGEAGGLGSKC